jgi:hypothetical protein
VPDSFITLKIGTIHVVYCNRDNTLFEYIRQSETNDARSQSEHGVACRMLSPLH